MDENEMIKKVCDTMLELTQYYKYHNEMSIEMFNTICKKHDL